MTGNERVLITAIGSFSAECVITSLKNQGLFVAGCDIYPKEWVANSRLTDHFRRAPLCSCRDEYLSFIKKYCADFNIGFIIPLIDPEVDILSNESAALAALGITVCAPNHDSVGKIRDKLAFSLTVNQVASRFDNIVPIQTLMLRDCPKDYPLPAVIKPINGRSSIGKRIISNSEELSLLKSLPEYSDYIIQPFIEGAIVTVDALRDSSGASVFCARRELLRTLSGAGTTVETIPFCQAEPFCGALLDALDVLGCVNIEFIEHVQDDGSLLYYPLEINPRFSGGIEFSCMSSFDFVSASFRIFASSLTGSPFSVKSGFKTCDHSTFARSYTAYRMM